MTLNGKSRITPIPAPLSLAFVFSGILLTSAAFADGLESAGNADGVLIPAQRRGLPRLGSQRG